MEEYKIKVVETICAIFIYLMFKLVIQRIIRKVGAKFKYRSSRVKITNKIVSVLGRIIFSIMLIFILGVDQSELLIFFSTILTVLGVAFFCTVVNYIKHYFYADYFF
jgi:small-conductance mechanosensitive channel